MFELHNAIKTCLLSLAIVGLAACESNDDPPRPSSSSAVSSDSSSTGQSSSETASSDTSSEANSSSEAASSSDSSSEATSSSAASSDSSVETSSSVSSAVSSVIVPTSSSSSETSSSVASSSSAETSSSESSSSSSESAVDAGRDLMQSTMCSICHTDNEDGTWSGSTPIDINNWVHVTVDTEEGLTQYIVEQMPFGNAGGCTDVDSCASNIAAYMWSYKEENNDITIPMDTGWRVNPDTLSWDYGTNEVWYQPTAANDQLVYDLSTPENFYNAEMVVEYEVDQAFIDSGSNLQPFMQYKGDYSVYTFCWVGNNDMAVGPATATCLIENESLDISDDAGVQLGVQINNGDGTPAGTVTIKSVTITPAE